MDTRIEHHRHGVRSGFGALLCRCRVHARQRLEQRAWAVCARRIRAVSARGACLYSGHSETRRISKHLCVEFSTRSPCSSFSILFCSNTVRRGTTPEGLVIQATGQKIIVYASILSILFQALGAPARQFQTKCPGFLSFINIMNSVQKVFFAFMPASWHAGAEAVTCDHAQC